MSTALKYVEQSDRRDRYENTNWGNGVMHWQKKKRGEKHRETETGKLCESRCVWVYVLYMRMCISVFDRSHLLLETSKQIHLKIKQRDLEVLQEAIL